MDAAVAEGVADFDVTSGIGYVLATSQNANNFNADLNGVDNDNFNADDTWTELGAINDPVSADGSPVVPEPSAYSLLLGFTAATFVMLRRRPYLSWMDAV